MKPALLYVDDEEENLKVFKRVFKKNFEIHTALSGEEGLDVFEAHPEITLLVSDQRMPGMSGVDFLNACKQINPYPVRVLITGYADLESTINAINEAEIYRFIKKPWEKLDLLQTLNEAQKRYELEKELKEKNEELLSLDKLKTKFMMLVNHELKTPLTVQRSYLEMLNESLTEEEQKIFLQKSLQGSDRLEKLISEILFFLKVQKGEFSDKAESFELSEASGLHDLAGTKIETQKILFCEATKRILENAKQHKKEGTDIEISHDDQKLAISNQVEENLDVDLVLQPFEINEDAFNHSKGLGMGLSIAALVYSKLGFKFEVHCHKKTFLVSVDLSDHLA